MHLRHIRAAALAGAILTIAIVPSFATAPTASTSVAFERSVPVRLLRPANGDTNRVAPPRINPLGSEPDHGQRGTWTRGMPLLDPLVHGSQSLGHVPSVDLLFDGTANPFACGGCTPPDPVGA